jgi:uncharacterized protein (DUF2267 family)
MTNDEFLAAVRERGEYRDAEQAEHAAMAVLAALAERLAVPARLELARRLPDELGGVLLAADDHAPAWDVEPTQDVDRFLTQVADELAWTSTGTARQDAEAVLWTVADAISDRHLDDLLSQLPATYGALFGDADVALLLPA